MVRLIQVLWQTRWHSFLQFPLFQWALESAVETGHRCLFQSLAASSTELIRMTKKFDGLGGWQLAQRSLEDCWQQTLQCRHWLRQRGLFHWLVKVWKQQLLQCR